MKISDGILLRLWTKDEFTGSDTLSFVTVARCSELLIVGHSGSYIQDEACDWLREFSTRSWL